MNAFRERFQELYDAISLLKAEKEQNIEPSQYDTFEAAFCQTTDEQNRVMHNKRAIDQCKQRCSEYFDHLFAYPLDEQQRDSIVPLQDFTANSDIDWSKPVADIDQQLYRKYNLSDDEIAFVEKMIKPME